MAVRYGCRGNRVYAGLLLRFFALLGVGWFAAEYSMAMTRKLAMGELMVCAMGGMLG